jgi:hypothetical protein
VGVTGGGLSNFTCPVSPLEIEGSASKPPPLAKIQNQKHPQPHHTYGIKNRKFDFPGIYFHLPYIFSRFLVGGCLFLSR